MKGVLITVILFILIGTAYAEWTIVGSYQISGKASGLAYDGTYLYYGIYGADGGRVFRFDPSTGQEILLFNNPAIGDSYGMTFDGEYLWIVDRVSSPSYALQLNMSGNIISQFNLPDQYMSGIAYDNGDFWVMTYYPDPGVVYKVTNTGTILQQFTPPNDQPWDICLEGDALWIVDYWAYTIHKVSQTGTILEIQESEIQRPAGIVFDGQYLWYLAGALSAPSTLYKVDLGGTGTPVIDVSFTEYDFGNVMIDDLGSTNLTITNTGTGDLTIDQISFTGSVFDTDALLPITLEQNESTEVSISFTPDDWGGFSEIMTIFSNDPISPALPIDLTGYGLFPNASIVITPDNLDYGLIRVGADTGRFFTLSNQGMTELQISNISFSDQSFYIDDTVQIPIILPTRAEYELRIWFHPSSAGQIVATATISSNDPDEPQANITIVGSGQTVDLAMGTQLWNYQIEGNVFNNIRAIQPIPDIWGNGLDDVIVCGEDYYVRALNGNSSGTADVIWEQHIPSGAVYSYRGLTISGDLNGDGNNDVVVGTTGGDRAVRAYSGRTGELLWTFYTNIYGSGGWVYQVDARYDHNNDGIPDVLAATGDDANDQGPKRIFLLDGATGSMIWERYVQGPAFSVKGVVDFTGDGVPDVIAGASNESESQAFVYGINGATGAIEWSMQPAGTSVWALSQIDDVNNDGIPDVLVGSFLGGGSYYALNAVTGGILWSGSTGASMIMQFEVLGDVNGDGFNDIAIGHVAPHAAIFSGEDGEYIWSQNVADNAWYIANGGDLTGNGINDLVLGTLYQNNYAYFIDSTTGEILHSIATGTPVDAIGTISDVTGDNSREMIVGGRNGTIRCYSGGPVTLPDPGYISGNVEIAEGPGSVTEVVVTANGVSTHPDNTGCYTLTVQPGTYTVTASLEGYLAPPVTGVVVTAGTTTEDINFLFLMLPLVPPVDLEVDVHTGVFSWNIPESEHGYYPEGYKVFLDSELYDETTEVSYTFESLSPGMAYLAGVSALYATGESEIATIEFTFQGSGVDEEDLPMVTKLFGNYPNPFNPETTIQFSLESASQVTIDIFNIKGERIKRLVNDHLDRGNYQPKWNGTNEAGRPQASGIYFYRFVAGEYSETRKMLLLK